MIGIGVIGYGYWGPNLARCVADTDGCALVGIADSSPAALMRAGKRHPSAKLYDSWRDLIADPRIDAVLIATPVSTHFDLALNALRARKHVLVEKPITATSEEARILIDVASHHRLVLMVDHTFVYTSAVQKISDIIGSGDLGDLFYYDSTRVNLGLFQRDVNVIWDLAVHDLSILDFVLAERPVAVSASGAGHIRGSLENMAHLTLFYPGGAVAHLNVNWLAPVKVRQTLIGGSRRMIVYNDLDPIEKIKIYDRGVTVGDGHEDIDPRVSYRTGDMWAPQLSVKEALLTELEHFVDCIETRATPITSGASGLHVVETLECAMASLRQRGHPVEIEALMRAS
ncbi:Gfo/Idh/MocA family protein [Roseomonas xinghualingensis]|uniref:Gfo/Idh/MocA family protein n=1 Tax=Roseomonas xinghualingensis TaxID=2986475 RepID=UPI0021F13EB5|nr:Gfo/Idh/MocA family oxidoreductase [Roseomonas sp. SXEYE001]MCV4210050.1 Gfo/Idh/MocA family oxidoreductase [Roseomonas sp. SXEYE001]